MKVPPSPRCPVAGMLVAIALSPFTDGKEEPKIFWGAEAANDAPVTARLEATRQDPWLDAGEAKDDTDDADESTWKIEQELERLRSAKAERREAEERQLAAWTAEKQRKDDVENGRKEMAEERARAADEAAAWKLQVQSMREQAEIDREEKHQKIVEERALAQARREELMKKQEEIREEQEYLDYQREQGARAQREKEDAERQASSAVRSILQRLDSAAEQERIEMEKASPVNVEVDAEGSGAAKANLVAVGALLACWALAP